MPTAGTHITIVQRLAASSQELKELLGDPFEDDSTVLGRRMRFANLGAVGPDLFYAMLDYGAELQDLENFFAKLAGTFECISEVMGKIDRFVSGFESEITGGVSDSLKQTVGLISGIVKDAIGALFVDVGFNLWPVFEARRQQDDPREQWFWADFLHYVRTGEFTRKLIDNAQASGNPNLLAYAYGYLTHYVTDVVGHPYVNQVVQAPWRLYWQRHHLVENFIDAYVWDRFHNQRQGPADDEPPLDAVTETPNKTGDGAPFTFARLNDHIAIGIPPGQDPVDGIVQKICDDINAGLFQLGIAEDTDMAGPSDEEFQQWTALLANTLHDVYDSPRVHPQNLGNNGFPTGEDIGAAYMTMRLFLKTTTEEQIQEPTFPDIAGDIGNAVQRFLDDLEKNFSSFPPIPSLGSDFSCDGIWDAFKRMLSWIGDFLTSLVKTIFDILKDLLEIGITVIGEPIKIILYFLNKGLFGIYRGLRDTLMLAAYSIPFTDELNVSVSRFSTSTLWRSPGAAIQFKYPFEEILEERKPFLSSYAPFVPPANLRTGIEQPPVTFIAPYAARNIGGSLVFTLPDDFIGSVTDDPGPDDMFRDSGTEPTATTDDPRARHTFASFPKNFGSALANCKRGIQLGQQGFPGSATLPDYNLDGDRGYAWPDWDTDRVNAPLDPANPRNSAPGSDHVAHVDAQLITE